MEVKKTRNTHLEILRLVAMMMIFLHHAVAHGGTSFWGTLDFQDYIRESIFHLGKIGVIIYLLISGYCLVDSKFSWKRVIILLTEVLLFSIGFFIYHMIKSPEPINQYVIYGVIFPFSKDLYWFMSEYLILYLASPVINLAINHWGKKFLLPAIGCLFILASVIASFTQFSTYEQYFLIFILIYLIGAYFKRYPLPDLKWGKYLVLVFGIGLFLFMNYLVILFSKDNEAKTLVNRLFMNNNSPLGILIGVCIFVFTIQLKPFYSKWTNFILSGTLEIYLIHDNPYFRKTVFSLICDAKKIPYSNVWALQFVGVTLLRFLVVFAFALAIKFLFTNTFVNLINYINDKIKAKKEVTEIK